MNDSLHINSYNFKYYLRFVFDKLLPEKLEEMVLMRQSDSYQQNSGSAGRPAYNGSWPFQCPFQVILSYHDSDS